MATTQELLDQVDAAIGKVLSGGVAEFGEGSDRARMLSLSDLRQMRTQLQRQLAAENGSTGFKAVKPIQR